MLPRPSRCFGGAGGAPWERGKGREGNEKRRCRGRKGRAGVEEGKGRELKGRKWEGWKTSAA